MHEASLMNDLMRKILDLADQQGAARVVALKVRLGALSHMTPAHFVEHFEHASAGTIAEGAAIETVTEIDIQSSTAADVILESVEVA